MLDDHAGLDADAYLDQGGRERRRRGMPLPVGGRTAALVYLDREPENLGTLDPVALRELLAAAGDQLAAQIRRRKAGSRPASGR